METTFAPVVDPPSRLVPAPANSLRGAALGPALVAVASFATAAGNGFVNWDDTFNFVENPAIRGLGPRHIAWAWTTVHLGSYQPLGWMAVQAEYAAWGLDPRGYHLTSIALHAINSTLLFFLLLRLLELGRPDLRSDPRLLRGVAAPAAALFAAHPLRAEVVAWASCQFYLLCGFFSLLCVLAYLRGARPEGRHRTGWMAASWLLMLAALLSKPAAAGLPAVLVVLDVYPLRRLGPGRWKTAEARRAWVEKGLFLLPGLAVAALAVVAKAKDQGLATLDETTLPERVGRACFAAAFYPLKTLLPDRLTPLYPPPREALPYVAGAAVVLVVGALAIRSRRRLPALAAAWFAYLVLMAPTSGLIRFGQQVAADRYSYLATIPWYAAFAGLLVRARRPGRRPLVVGMGPPVLVVVAALASMSWRQCLVWHDSVALWSHAINRGAATDLAHNNLGAALASEGREDEAMAEYEAAVRLNPDHAMARFSLGTHLFRLGRLDEAIDQYRAVLRLLPDSYDAHFNLGMTLARAGRFQAALPHFDAARRLRPAAAAPRYYLGAALDALGRRDDAIAHYRDALRLQPDHPGALRALGRGT
ncbi:MAG TPA: tetratricopeptide repeat protein [Isosphaeraceae bacterium]|jgi:tetratricopeptide (TPR) repeat protein|nr:tetratricopeptide repeat protein [Isosphaeraceae bacterium]